MQLRATRLTCIAHAARRAVAPAFTPTLLFASGEQGVWYDPSDMTTLFQDAAGTVPVTAVEQPVGRMLDKSGRGNHATQATAINRPVLSARVNLLAKTEQFNESPWGGSGISVQADAEGTADKLIPSTTSTSQIRTQGSISVTPNTTYKLSIKAKKSGYRYFYFAIISAPTAGRIFDFDTGAYTSAITGSATYESESLPDGYFLLTQTFVTGANVTSVVVEAGVRDAPSFAVFAGDGVSGVLVKEADLRASNDGVGLPPYQRVNTATDYDSGPEWPRYLRFDGIDDGMVTSTITPGTDKVQVFAGVRKLSDAETTILLEFSAATDTNNGTLHVAQLTGPSRWQFISKGNGASASIANASAAPISSLLTGIGDISNDLSTLRIDGTQAAQSAADQGTGNYLAYPLYIGRRGGTSLPFNGRLYPLIVRFGPTLTAEQIAQTETWVNSKTRAYA